MRKVARCKPNEALFHVKDCVVAFHEKSPKEPGVVGILLEAQNAHWRVVRDLNNVFFLRNLDPAAFDVEVDWQVPQRIARDHEEVRVSKVSRLTSIQDPS